jgi:hypothetical protein
VRRYRTLIKLVSSVFDEIEDRPDSPPIQGRIPENLIAEDDIKWLLKLVTYTSASISPNVKECAPIYQYTCSRSTVERLGRDAFVSIAPQSVKMKLRTMLKAFYNDNYSCQATKGFEDKEMEDDIEIPIEGLDRHKT